MTFDADLVVRVIAAVAALALVAQPVVVAAWQQAQAWLAKKPVKPEAGIDDMHTVLELANRLRLAGNAEGVALCQKLIDVMLKGKPS